MCGISGIIDFERRHSPDRLRDLGLDMRETLSHRGPDDAGLWMSDDGMVCLGHRRLSVIDPRPEGRQPMVSASQRTALTFNGEVYNYRDLQQMLRTSGRSFVTATDTEVLLELLDDGDTASALSRVRGMYAFGMWSAPSRRLTLARDPFGKKPLYWTVGEGMLAFASELRALEALPGLCREVDSRAVHEYLLLQYVHAPRSVYRGVYKLEPGTWQTFTFPGDGRIVTEAPRRHFRFEASDPAPGNGVVPRDRPESEAVEELGDLLRDAVGVRLRADVPLGAFLSGGVDSSAVVAMMARELGSDVRTFSLGFAGSPDSEHLTARRIADHLGTEHHELVVEADAVHMLPVIADALDEPNGDSSCLPVYLLSEYTRRSVTVALSGDGGDEMFGGYRRYADAVREASDPFRQLRSLRRERRPWSRGRAYVGARMMLMPERLAARLAGRLDPEVLATIGRWRRVVADGHRPLIHAARTLDAGTYLPGAVLAKVDRMSMQFGLEVRCPLLDIRVARWASQLPAAQCQGAVSKRLLKRLASRYLPDDIVHRPKSGFGLPERSWSKPQLLAMATDLLTAPDTALRAFTDSAAVARYIDDQRDPARFSIYQIWALLVLEMWLRGRAAVPAGSRS